jgi:ribosome biogenesis GTPase
MESKRDGIVTRGHGNRFVVYAEGNYYDCQLRGKVKFKTEQTTPVAVGDDVRIAIIDDSKGVIESVGQRRSVLSRPAVGRETREHVLAANIDALVIVVSIKEPALKPGLIDRFIITADLGGLKPAIVMNKIDLGMDELSERAVQVYSSLGYDLFLTSALDGSGLDKFSKYLKEHRSILAGHSGVGKSSILNKLIPGVKLRTEGISGSTGRGRHTTSHMELFHLPEGGFTIDSPGLKVLGLWKLERQNLAGYYPEMLPYCDDCRFTGCSHIHEPDCAVKEAVETGAIAALRYQNYTQIYESLDD